MRSRWRFFNIVLKVANYLLFYLIWVGCLLTAMNGWAFVFACAVFLYIAFHLRFVSAFPGPEAVMIASLVGIGTLHDIVLTEGGVISYVDASRIGTSWWMTALWACFGSTYWHAFSWLDSKPWLAAILGAIAVPFCLEWGIQVGAVTLVMSRWDAFCIIGLLWAFLLPLSFVVSGAIKKKFGCLKNDM